MLNHVTGSIEIFQCVGGQNLLFSQIPFPLCFSVLLFYVSNGCFRPCWLQLSDNCIIKVFLLEQIVMLYLRARGHLLIKVVKKSISYTDCKVSVCCALNIFSPSL